MGTDPVTPAYDPGDDCNTCKDIIFNGITPLYVEAHVSGVEACPGGPAFDPNGVWLLTQVLECQWLGGAGGVGFNWILQLNSSIFTIVSGPAFFFSGTILSRCISTFTNDLVVCNVPATSGINGTVEVFWGPTIGP